MQTKHVSLLKVHPDDASNPLVSCLRLPVIIASHRHTLYTIFVFDPDFNFRKHISLCYFYQIREFRHIGRYISLSVGKPITTAIITSRFSSGELSYLCSRSSLAPKPRVLRPSSFHLLSVSQVKSHATTHAFSVAVPTLWNALTEHIKL